MGIVWSHTLNKCANGSIGVIGLIGVDYLKFLRRRKSALSRVPVVFGSCTRYSRDARANHREDDRTFADVTIANDHRGVRWLRS